MGARQRAELAELTEWVEGLRAAAHKARDEGNVTLADALDATRFEVYQSFLEEELNQQGQAVAGLNARPDKRRGVGTYADLPTQAGN